MSAHEHHPYTSSSSQTDPPAARNCCRVPGSERLGKPKGGCKVAIFRLTAMLACRILRSPKVLLLYKLRSGSASAGLAGAALLVILASCQIHNTTLFTETDGSYVRLPDKSTKAIVWGDNPEAVKSLKTWLLKQRVTLVDDVKINQIANDMGSTNPLERRRPQVGKNRWNHASYFGRCQCIRITGDRNCDLFWMTSGYNASLFIRALNVETGEIDWNGKARSTQPFTNLTEGIDQLTCQCSCHCLGLTTAWNGYSSFHLSPRTECNGGR